MKTQFFQMEFKNVEVKQEDNKIFIEWYASTPDIDSYDDIVKPEAFEKTMSEYMRKPLVLLQHNIDKIIGKVVDSKIEANGLWVRVELFNDLDWTFKSIQEWLLWQFSIWFQAIKWNMYELWERYIREITELRLVEISVVAFPANKNAVFNLTKSLKEFFDWLDKKDFWTYEVKWEEIEFINFEKKQEEEQKKVDEPIKEEEKQEEIMPPIEEENPTEPIKAESDEIVGEIPAIVEEAKKEDELKALKEEIELLKKDNQELKVTLEAKDEELKNITESKADLEKKLEEKEIEIKDYLSTWIVLETKSNKVSIARWYSLFDNL